MRTSATQTMGACVATDARARSPSSTVSSTSKPAAARKRVRQSRIGGWSSATTTVVRARWWRGVTLIVPLVFGGDRAWTIHVSAYLGIPYFVDAPVADQRLGRWTATPGSPGTSAASATRKAAGLT